MRMLELEYNKFVAKMIEPNSWSLIVTIIYFSETTNMIRKYMIDKPKWLNHVNFGKITMEKCILHI